MDLSAWREEFPILGRKTYLNTCSLGPLSRRSRAAVGTFLDQWEDLGASAWYQLWMGEVDLLRERFARLVGGRPGEVAILPSASAALSVLASTLDYGSRPEVVVGALDFPTIPYQWQAKPGVKVRLLPSPDGLGVPAPAFEEAVGPATAGVATTHVVFTTGCVQDVAAIGRAARREGAASFVDGYHGAGQVPLDVRALGVDAYMSGGLKWLLGGPGVVYLWVREERIRELTPQITSWFAHARQFDFDPTRFEPAPDARRYELGTPSVASVFAARQGLDIVLEAGPGRIRRRTLELVGDLDERLRDAGFGTLLPPPDRRSGILGVPDDDPRRTVAALAAEDIVVDARPGRVRVSPYFYNTEEENERFVAALSRIRSGR